MPFINLSVITPVIEKVDNMGDHLKQISIRDASSELLDKIKMANEKNKINITIYGLFELVISDPLAIYGVEQKYGVQVDDFSSLYSFLSRRPDESIKFEW
jgi:hypothetical protein